MPCLLAQFFHIILHFQVLIYSPDGRCLSKYQAYESGLGVKSVSWSPCSQFLAVGSYDQMIRVLNHLTWKVFAEFTHLSNVRGPCAAAVFKVGKTVVTFTLWSCILFSSLIVFNPFSIIQEVDEPLLLDMSELSLSDEFIQRSSGEFPSFLIMKTHLLH